MKLKLLSAMFLASALLTSGCDQTSQQTGKTGEILVRAESYLNQGQFSAASIEARNALKEDPQNIDAQLLLARIYLEQGNYSQSSRMLRELPQTNLKVVELLGESYLFQAKFKSLRELLKAASSMDGANKSWPLNRLKAISLVQQSKMDQAKTAIDALAAAATTPADKASAEMVRSLYCSQNNDTAGQLKALDQALTYSPGYVDALVEKAKHEYKEKNYEAAEDLLSQALISLPRTDVMTLKRMEVLQAMASTLSRQNRSGEAMIYSKLIAEANPKAQELQNEFEQGIEKLKAGDVKGAEEVLSKLYVTDHAKLAGSVLGLIKFKQGDFKEAAEFFQETVDTETASPEVLRAYAESQLRMRDPEMALKTIESNIQEHPEDPGILSVYGLALLATGKTAQGIETLQKVLQMEPARSNLRVPLAITYNSQGKPDLALQELEKAYAGNKESTSIQERLAMQYAAMGKTNELARFAQELGKSPSTESRALAGLILLRADPKAGARLLDELYAKSPADPAVLRAQLRKNMLESDNANVIKIGKQLIGQDANDINSLGAVLQAYSRQGELAAGINYLNGLVDQSASAWGPSYVLAAQAFMSQDYRRATDQINQAVARSAYNDATTRLYTQIYLANASNQAQAGNYPQAREIIMEAMQNNEVNPDLMHLLIRIELSDKNISEAEKLVGELQQSAPGAAVTEHAQGDLALAKEDKTAALQHFQAAWKLKPSDAIATDIWKMQASESAAKQDAFLQEWQQKLPKSIAVLNIQGIRLQEKGNPAGAIKAYESSLTINQFQPVILNNLAWLLMEANQLDAAYKHAEKAAQLAGGRNASILDTFGWIAFKSGKKDVALKNLEKALELQPDSAEIKSHLAAVKGK